MNLKQLYIALSLGVVPLSGFAAEPDLPKVEILGKEYYVHEVGKGESIYGVAHKYDWNLDELVRLNPHTASEMKKGTRLYYPTGRVAVLADSNKPVAEGAEVEYEPIRHTVRKGETVYGISKLYNIPLDDIYAAYPNAKYGVKAGETLVFEQRAPRDDKNYLYYVIRPGDTLYSVANKYNTTVEGILNINPGISETNFRIGDTVRIAVNSKSRKLHTELVDEERLASVETYKVKKNDTWKSIAKNTGVDVETLKEANETVSKPEKNELIAVPVMETVQVEKEVPFEDPRELTRDGIREIYDSIHRVDSDVEKLAEVRIAVLLDEPTSKKDIDFSRGFLLGLDDLKKSQYKIEAKFIDGRGSTTSVTDQLDEFEPTVLIATADKTFPAFLADYGETNHLEIVNVFDVRNDLFEDNPSMVQMLAPSSFFNELVGTRLTNDYDKWNWIMAGDVDTNDALATIVTENILESKVRKVSGSYVPELELADGEPYVFYAYTQKKEEITDLLSAVSMLKEKYPLSEFVVIGRPSWVTMPELFRDKFTACDLLIPARCWFDPESREGKKFIEQYETAYNGSTPVKSFPNFAASGYDTARYFVEAAARNGGDFNRTVPVGNGVQTQFDLKRVSNWGGFINPVVYILQFRPFGYVDKIVLK